MDRCPICNVAVKPENLIRHLDDIHPRHPDTPRLREKLKEEPGRLARRAPGGPIRIRRWHVFLVVAIVVGGLGAYYVVQVLTPSRPFPCVSGVGRAYHWHATLSIDQGNPPAAVTIPGNIGIGGGCMQLIHTHGADGQIHIEPDTPDQARIYTLADFFLAWGKPFGSPILMHVNGTQITPPTPNSPLYDGTSIHLQYSSFSP